MQCSLKDGSVVQANLAPDLASVAHTDSVLYFCLFKPHDQEFCYKDCNSTGKTLFAVEPFGFVVAGWPNVMIRQQQNDIQFNYLVALATECPVR